MFKPLEIVGDTAFRTTDQKVRGSNPFERARQFNPLMRVISFCSPVILLWTKSARNLYESIGFSNYSIEEKVISGNPVHTSCTCAHDPTGNFNSEC